MLPMIWTMEMGQTTWKAICLHSGVIILQSGVIAVDICSSSPFPSFAQAFADQMPKMPNRPLSNHFRWFCRCFATIFDLAFHKLHSIKLRACCEATQWQAARRFSAVQEQVCQLVLQPNTWWLASSKLMGKIQHAEGEWSILKFNAKVLHRIALVPAELVSFTTCPSAGLCCSTLWTKVREYHICLRPDLLLDLHSIADWKYTSCKFFSSHRKTVCVCVFV